MLMSQKEGTETRGRKLLFQSDTNTQAEGLIPALRGSKECKKSQSMTSEILPRLVNPMSPIHRGLVIVKIRSGLIGLLQEKAIY